jgi:PQQ-like domain
VYLSNVYGYVASFSVTNGSFTASSLAARNLASTNTMPTLSLDGRVLYVLNNSHLFALHTALGNPSAPLSLRASYLLEGGKPVDQLLIVPSSSVPANTEGDIIIASLDPYSSIQRAIWQGIGALAAIWKRNDLTPATCPPTLSHDGLRVLICLKYFTSGKYYSNLTSLSLSNGNTVGMVTLNSLTTLALSVDPSSGDIYAMDDANGILQSYDALLRPRYNVTLAASAFPGYSPATLGPPVLQTGMNGGGTSASAVYVLQGNGRVYAVNAASGQRLWSKFIDGMTGSSAFSSPVMSAIVGTTGAIYIAWEPTAGTTGAVSCLNPQDGSSNWTLPLDAPVRREMALSGSDGALWVTRDRSDGTSEVISIVAVAPSPSATPSMTAKPTPSFSPSPSPPPPPLAWPQYRGNPYRSGYSGITAGPVGNSFTISANTSSVPNVMLPSLKALVTGLTIGSSSSNPNNVFTTNGDGYTFVLNSSASGRPTARTAATGQLSNSIPALSLDQSTVCIPQPFIVYCAYTAVPLATATPALTMRTTYTMPCNDLFQFLFIPSFFQPYPNKEGDLIVVCQGFTSAIVRAVWNGASMLAAWKRTDMPPFSCPPSMSYDGQRVWICTLDTTTNQSNLTSLYLLNGTLVTSTPIGSMVAQALAVDPANGNVYLTAANGLFYSFRSNGALRFNLPLTTAGLASSLSPIALGPPTGPSGSAAFALLYASDTTMWAINITTGVQMWSKRIPGSTVGVSSASSTLTSPIVGSTGAVYLAWEPNSGKDGAVSRINPLTGSTFWTLALDSPVKSEMALAADGSLWVAKYGSNTNAEVFALMAVTPSPTPSPSSTPSFTPSVSPSPSAIPPPPVSYNKGLNAQRNGQSWYTGLGDASASSSSTSVVQTITAPRWTYSHLAGVPFLFNGQPLMSSDGSRIYATDNDGKLLMLAARDGTYQSYADPAALYKQSGGASDRPSGKSVNTQACLREGPPSAQDAATAPSRFLLYSPRNTIYRLNASDAVDDSQSAFSRLRGYATSSSNYSSPLCMSPRQIYMAGAVRWRGQGFLFAYNNMFQTLNPGGWVVSPASGGGTIEDVDFIGPTASPKEDLLFVPLTVPVLAPVSAGCSVIILNAT